MKDTQLIYTGQYCLKIWKYGYNSFSEKSMTYGTTKIVQQLGRYILYWVDHLLCIYTINSGMIRMFKDTKKFVALMHNNNTYVLIQDFADHFTLYDALHCKTNNVKCTSLAAYVNEKLGNTTKNIVYPETMYDRCWPNYVINRNTYYDLSIHCS